MGSTLLKYEGVAGHFAPVQVNDTLTLDFDNRDQFESHHYAFHVNDEDFNAIFDRVKADGASHTAAGLLTLRIWQINTRREGRGFYFQDTDGHLLELLTRT